MFKNLMGKQPEKPGAPENTSDNLQSSLESPQVPGAPAADAPAPEITVPDEEMGASAAAGADGMPQLNEQTRRALSSKFRAAAFGEVVAILMRSQNHRGLRLADMEWLVVPAVLTRQFVIARAKPQEDANAASVPIGVAFWARVSDEVDQRLATDGNVRLKPEEWNSGENHWLLEIVAPPKVAGAMLNELKRTTFAGRAFKVRRLQEGKIVVDEMQGEAAAA